MPAAYAIVHFFPAFGKPAGFCDHRGVISAGDGAHRLTVL
jgi:hypothetical protein